MGGTSRLAVEEPRAKALMGHRNCYQARFQSSFCWKNRCGRDCATYCVIVNGHSWGQLSHLRNEHAEVAELNGEEQTLKKLFTSIRSRERDQVVPYSSHSGSGGGGAAGLVVVILAAVDPPRLTILDSTEAGSKFEAGCLDVGCDG